MFDVAIVGSGPAGASCAAFCAGAGLRAILLERENFPREKVCGDCLNPSCTPVLERLDLTQRLHALPHGEIKRVEFIAIDGSNIGIELRGKRQCNLLSHVQQKVAGGAACGEIAVKRSLFDQLVMTRAAEAGVEVRHAATVSAVIPPHSATSGWVLKAGGDSIVARVLVAGDGRNSTIARALHLLPRIEKERIALQTHLPLPRDFGERVVLQFLPGGYSGQAPIGNAELNLCLVGKPATMPALRRWAEARFALPRDQAWRTITPLRRAALAPAQRRLFFVGDAARVVEPFTGEGIYYALHSGELAAEAISQFFRDGDEAAAARAYTAAHEKLYRGRLWVNQLARAAVLSPQITSLLLRRKLLPRAVLRSLTTKVVR